ncbi:MAG: hypothetical protein JRG96_05000 [Deltaproteobacteria bacterium]|nr:hypothetical protein [Deltaproteobacteria bacterium]MBW2417935.1 hypothetical protein [Deltaproteobacteria bacterium]
MASGGEARRLGLIESFVAARDQCPSGRVRSLASAALEAVKRDKQAALHEQAFLLLSATRGWRGERADQVRQSLAAFLEETPQLDRGDTVESRGDAVNGRGGAVTPSDKAPGGDPEREAGD